MCVFCCVIEEKPIWISNRIENNAKKRWTYFCVEPLYIYYAAFGVMGELGCYGGSDRAVYKFNTNLYSNLIDLYLSITQNNSLTHSHDDK